MMSRRTRRKFKNPILKHALRAGMLAAAVGSPLFAQNTTADVVGTATDATGAVIPNATVELTDVNTHDKRTVQTGSGGEYTFTLLKPSTYSLSVTAPGFKSFQISAFNMRPSPLRRPRPRCAPIPAR